ncbi:MAG TPA: hypothetical protein VIT45_09385 [Allosphingosinicella sp.]
MIEGLAVGLALVCVPDAASAKTKHSAPADLRRFIEVTRSLEQAPLGESASENREWALAWLTEAPDVSVTLCTDALGGMDDGEYPHTAEIILQDSFAMGAFAIEHPDKANDPEAQQLAGVEGALNAYRSILRDRPEAKSAFLDKLLQTRAEGGLGDHVRQALVRCSAKK